ncbi:hypothetical protein Desti_2079 [Desulfomonile tiedjei DSM 6799]|uniref:Thioredoxin-like fold domain-containing protein n=2 Tax=Desulfomonile tiedjei TaxID=2358 RepID=I4C5D9_DESTA|nr:hypothetical protein [Desulfomonile tiedjei]AFM24780.1 hypothetical protein Desti_2079 [Desulfomonile tiedjei DSM 6799]
MASRLGAEYPIEIETTSKPFAEYRTDEWADTDLPCAPAIMIGEEIVAEGSDVTEEKVANEIRKQLGMPPLEPEKKGIIDRLFR